MYKFFFISKIFVVFFSILLSSSVRAEVYVNGPIYGSFCKGFGIKLCSEERIDTTIKSGTMYTLPDSFRKADEKKGGSCFKNISNKSSFWGKLAKSASGISPVFYQYKSGPRHLESSYKKLGTPEYLRFKCF